MSTREEKVCQFIERYCLIPEGSKVGQPSIYVARERFAPYFGILGYIRFDGCLSDTAAVKHLFQSKKTGAALLDVSAAPAGLRKQERLPSKSDTIYTAHQR